MPTNSELPESRLLALPPELRNPIYELVIEDSCSCGFYLSRFDGGRGPAFPNLAHVSRKTRVEILPMFLSKLTVRPAPLLINSCWDWYLNPVWKPDTFDVIMLSGLGPTYLKFLTDVRMKVAIMKPNVCREGRPFSSYDLDLNFAGKKVETSDEFLSRFTQEYPSKCDVQEVVQDVLDEIDTESEDCTSLVDCKELMRKHLNYGGINLLKSWYALTGQA
ncbi:hypothetical protein MBLNU230_g2619t1 [Neophaeotheca triangularis]